MQRFLTRAFLLIVFLTLIGGTQPLLAQVFSVTAEPDSLGAIPDGGPDGPGDYGSARVVLFEVSGTEGLVGSAQVEFSANHPFVSDLRVRLVSPNGFAHQLFAQSGVTVESSEGFATNLSSNEVYSFSDSAPAHWWTLAGIEENGVPADVDIPSGSARTVKSGGQSEPDQLPDITSMNETFLGAPMDGTWLLIFEDGWEEFEGEVTAASLILEFDTADLIVSNANNDGPGSLRQAMLDAQSGQTIAFDPGFFISPSSIELTEALPEITQPVFIQGPGADLLGITRSESADSFALFQASGFDGTFAISGLRLFGGSSFAGGAISHAAQYLRVSGLDIDNNNSDLGGGVFIRDAEGALIIDSSIRLNSASTDGSGIYAGCNGDRDCIFALVNSTVSGNLSGIGGPASIAIEADRGAQQRLQLFNSTIVSNGLGIRLTALESGGSSGTVVQASYSSNLFGNTEASIAEGAESVGTVETVTLGGNLSNLDEPDLFAGQFDLWDVDPALEPLDDNGGPTFTHALPADSPAVDIAVNSANLAFDQRGPGFVRVFGERADAGAFEFQPEDRIFGSRFEFMPDIVTFDDVNFVPVEDFNGGSIRWIDGTDCDCDDDDFDFNVFAGSTARLQFFWPRIQQLEGGVTVDGSTYAVLASGDTIGPGSEFISSLQPSATTPWSTPGNVTGYLGFRFEDEGQVKYGYALISTGDDGRPFTLISYAFDNSGAPIVIP